MLYYSTCELFMPSAPKLYASKEVNFVKLRVTKILALVYGLRLLVIFGILIGKLASVLFWAYWLVTRVIPEQGKWKQFHFYYQISAKMGFLLCFWKSLFLFRNSILSMLFVTNAKWCTFCTKLIVYGTIRTILLLRQRPFLKYTVYHHLY